MSGVFRPSSEGIGDNPYAGGGTIYGGGPNSGSLSGAPPGTDLPSDQNLPGGYVPGNPQGPPGAPGGGTPAFPAGGGVGMPAGLGGAPSGFTGPVGARGADPNQVLAHVLALISKQTPPKPNLTSGFPGKLPTSLNLPAILASIGQAPGKGRAA